MGAIPFEEKETLVFVPKSTASLVAITGTRACVEMQHLSVSTNTSAESAGRSSGHGLYPQTWLSTVPTIVFSVQCAPICCYVVP